MGKPAARMTDKAGHGGTITIGCSTTVFIGGLPAARVGDSFVCPGFDGPKPHVMGSIMMGSTTVMIDGAYAARMGDTTSCGMAGVSGKGMPPVISSKNSDETAGSMVGDDSAGLGNYKAGYRTTNDSAQGSAEVSGAQAHGELALGGDVKAKGNIAVGQGKASGSGGMTDSGMGYKAEGEANTVAGGGSIGTDNNSVGVSGKGPNAEAKGDFLMGNDGSRTGVALGGKAEAGLGSVKGSATNTVPIPFTDYNIAIGRSGEVAAGSVGAGLGAGAYHDAGDDRYHLTGFGEIKIGIGVDVEFDLSIGEKKVTGGGGTPGIGMGATPGTVLTGFAQVLIG